MSAAARLTTLRAVLGALVALDLLSFYIFLGEARADALANGVSLTLFTDLLSRPPGRALVILIGLAAVALFVRGPGRLGAGLAALGCLVLLSTAHAQLYGSPWRHLFFSGLCLAGWLLGLAVTRWRGAPHDESYARVGATALLGAAYLNSGISKIVFSGWDWVSGLPIQVVVVGQDGLVADGVLAGYRAWVASTPTVAALFAFATAVFELAGPLMLAGPRIRRLTALGLFAMHANIYLLTHILYWESMVLLLAFGVWASDAEPAPAGGVVPMTGRSTDRRFAWATALLAVAALAVIAHQTRRHWARRDQPPAVPAPAAPAPLSAAQDS